MKKYILIVLCVFIATSVFAQNIVIDTAIARVQYKFTDATIKQETRRTDTMNLDIGRHNICKFYSYRNYIIDSIRRTIDQSLWFIYKTTNNKYNIYVNYPQNEITVVDYAKTVINSLIYTEQIEIPKWNITNETEKILMFTCHKATCQYKGRNYIAWYTPIIPISFGPYKFTGLPGLILKIYDTENLFTFEAISTSYSDSLIVFTKKKNTKNITKKEFNNINKRFAENPKVYAERMFESLGVKVDALKEVPQSKKLPYNPIELEE